MYFQAIMVCGYCLLMVRKKTRGRTFVLPILKMLGTFGKVLSSRLSAYQIFRI